MKVTVLVRYPTGFKAFKRKSYIREENEWVKLRKKTKDSSLWEMKLPVGSVVPHKTFFRVKYYSLAMPDAPAAIVLKRDLKDDEIPVWDRRTSKKFLDAQILHRRGEEPKEGKGSLALWILAVLQIATIIVILIATNTIRIG